MNFCHLRQQARQRFRATSRDLQGRPGKCWSAPGNLRAPPGTSGQSSKINRCLDLPHSAENTKKKQENPKNSGKVADFRRRRPKQAPAPSAGENANQTNSKTKTRQSNNPPSNQAISKPQQQLASQYRNQSVGRMARRKKLTTTSTCVNHYHLDDD